MNQSIIHESITKDKKLNLKFFLSFQFLNLLQCYIANSHQFANILFFLILILVKSHCHYLEKLTKKVESLGPNDTPVMSSNESSPPTDKSLSMPDE